MLRQSFLCPIVKLHSLLPKVYTKVPPFLFTCYLKHFIVFIASETPILYLWHFLTSYCWYKGKLFNCFILLLYLFPEANMSADNLAFQPFWKKKLLLRGKSLLSIQHFKCILSLSLYLHTHTHNISIPHLCKLHWLVQKSSHVIPQQEPGFIPCVSNFRALESLAQRTGR